MKTRRQYLGLKHFHQQYDEKRIVVLGKGVVVYAELV